LSVRGIDDDVDADANPDNNANADDANIDLKDEVEDDAGTGSEGEVQEGVEDDAEAPSSTWTFFSAMKILRRFYFELKEDWLWWVWG